METLGPHEYDIPAVRGGHFEGPHVFGFLIHTFPSEIWSQTRLSGFRKSFHESIVDIYDQVGLEFCGENSFKSALSMYLKYSFFSFDRDNVRKIASKWSKWHFYSNLLSFTWTLTKPNNENCDVEINWSSKSSKTSVVFSNSSKGTQNKVCNLHFLHI